VQIDLEHPILVAERCHSVVLWKPFLEDAALRLVTDRGAGVARYVGAVVIVGEACVQPAGAEIATIGDDGIDAARAGVESIVKKFTRAKRIELGMFAGTVNAADWPKRPVISIW